jgi:GNAT superfamily N-acetyltransferase
MFTEEDHRRKGLARKLLRAAIDFGKASGLRYVKLHASDYGIPLYESEGFEAWNEMSLDLGE